MDARRTPETSSGRRAIGSSMGYHQEVMSRSRRKTPVTGITTAETEKDDKRFANRRQRRVNRELLESTGDDTRLKDRRETSDPWSMAKDGKGRFDPKRHPNLMRK